MRPSTGKKGPDRLPDPLAVLLEAVPAGLDDPTERRGRHGVGRAIEAGEQDDRDPLRMKLMEEIHGGFPGKDLVEEDQAWPPPADLDSRLPAVTHHPGDLEAGQSLERMHHELAHRIHVFDDQ